MKERKKIIQTSSTIFLFFNFFLIRTFLKDIVFQTSLLKFGCLGTSCLLLEGEKRREKVKEEIEMPKGSSLRICSFSPHSVFFFANPFLLSLSLSSLLCTLYCALYDVDDMHYSSYAHIHLTVFFFFLLLLLSLSIVCSHIHIDILLLVTATSRTLLVDFLVLFTLFIQWL